MEWNVYNLLNGEEQTCYTLKEVFEIVKTEREILVTDSRGKKVHFKDGVKIGEN